jgi:(p)ppGpp synthase/HD superfamily hydrolase
MSIKIDLACKIAAIAHNGHNRKGKDVPYIVHPMAVAILLAQAGAPDEVIIAGILHDTVEDTGLTLENIEEQFGPAVAGIVEGCSEPDKSKPWEDRKEHTLKTLKTAPDGVWLVTCADKLHNVRDMVVDYTKQRDALWGTFNRGKEEQAWYYRSIIEALAGSRDYNPELFDEFKAEVDSFLNYWIS